MFCTKCGKELKEGAKFCENCGEKVVDAQAKQEQTAKKSNTGKIIAIVLISIFLFLALIIGGIVMVARSIMGSFDDAMEQFDGTSSVFEIEEDDDDDGASSAQDETYVSDGDWDPSKYADYEHEPELQTWEPTGLYDYTDYSSFVKVHGDSYMAYFAEDFFSEEGGSYYENVLKGKNIENIMNYEYGNYVITADGTNYMFAELTSGFLELDKDSVYPAALDGGASYIIPTSDDGKVGDLYFIGYNKQIPKLIAHNVVASSNGIAERGLSNDQLYYFYFQKYEDGQYSMALATTPALDLLYEMDYVVTERVLAKGEYMPLFADEDELYYLDVAGNSICYMYKEEVIEVYSGDYDQYYVMHNGDILIVNGNDVYYFDPDKKETVQFPMTGLDDIVCKSPMSMLGYNKGTMVYAADSYLVLVDCEGKQYFMDYGEICELTHNVYDPHVDYFDAGVLTYIQDGVLLYDRISRSGVETYVKFDKEKVIDYCSSMDALYFFVLTDQGNLYYRDFDKDEDVLVDSGVELNKDKSGGNIAYDYPSMYVLYGKDGEMKAFDVLDRGYTDDLDLPHGRFDREGIFNYYFLDGSDEKHYILNCQICSIY